LLRIAIIYREGSARDHLGGQHVIHVPEPALAVPRWAGGAKPSPQIVDRPPNLAGPKFIAVLLAHYGQLILRKKNSKFDATGCQILRLKCTKLDFHSGFAPDTLRELTAFP